MGGFGGDGNRAGNVTVDQAGTITVDGGYTVGLMAQSIGGGGGRGGINVAAAGAGSDQTFGGAYTVGVGGFGGDGADAGTVNVTSIGRIDVNRYAESSELPVLPEPDDSVAGFISDFLTSVGLTALEKTQDTTAGLLAQSVGGGGGVGGFNGNLTVSPRGNIIQAGVGGFGGAGGNADAVSVDRGTDAPNSITTFGANASGLVAQSIGGGGGIAGMNLGLAIGRQTNAGAGTPDTYGATIVVGGSGGAAGNAGAVDVAHTGDITTLGTNSDAITAQSIGGGGGSANYSIGLGRFAGAKAAANIGIGGGAGDGGFGDAVTVAHTGLLSTRGTDAMGIRAQSIGGGGGNTALTLALALSVENKLSFTMGRFGGDGGVGGNVSVAAAGQISTTGQGGTAIFAQSVGGGGGTSSAYSAGVTVGTGGTGTPGSTKSNGVSAAFGLQGGSGAEAGDVAVANTALLQTQGANARGIFAQSIGGGGGAGGSATSLAFLDQTQIGLAMGGSGGTGGISGTVDVTNSGNIFTAGADAEAILAQSVGGGGGVGGMVNVIGVQVTGAASGNTQTTMNVAVGGTGGTGDDADAVTVANSAQLVTSGNRSYGVRAESIGGGGGSGGAVANVRLQGKSQSLGVDINVGGSGGTGGSGDNVDVTNSGAIFTSGTDAAGIVATSVGGGGGSAGLIIDMVVGGGGSAQSNQFKLNIGGSGGSGGTAGDVTVTNAAPGSITTTGTQAYGILAQSVGGGGGRGSSVVSITGVAGTDSTTGIGLTIGGAGGSGNDAGDVVVSNLGRIDTSGGTAHGIFAQSIGGGGGNGGLALVGAAAGAKGIQTAAVAVGGTGGGGGAAGDVTVTNTGTIITRGDGADGIRAQSVGGGGGNANVGLSLGGPGALIGNGLNGLLGAIGGGSGGAGGTVTVNQNGSVMVMGRNAQAVTVQAVNGGGGTLGFDITGITSLPGTPLETIVANLGSEDTDDTAGVAVTMNMVGTQVVAGAGGTGSGVQSVGGGGGTAYLNLGFVPTAGVPASGVSQGADVAAVFGEAGPIAAARTAATPLNVVPPEIIGQDVMVTLGATGGDNNGGGNASLNLTGDVLTSGIGTAGQIVQSIGGGGGRASVLLDVSANAVPNAVIVAAGGANVTNSSGGAVSAVQAGQISTEGAIAPAVILQSVGGGGGSAGVGLSAGGPLGALAQATLGGTGGAGNDGGSVTGSYTGGLFTTGERSVGLIAQSIGGGGGEVRLAAIVASSVTLGGDAGASGNGGAVAISNAGTIGTTGAGGHGVLLQSIGGGGGAVFGAGLPAPTLRAGGNGDGGVISFTQAGNIIAAGDAAFGLIAQSIGGGGGWVDGRFAGTAGGTGQGGAITLDIDGDVDATGLNSTAILAQSLGSTGGGAITVTLAGNVRGGSGSGSGVQLAGGADNLVTSGGTLSAVSRLAMVGTAGNDTLINNGSLFGNVLLGGGNNRLINSAGATFMIGETVQLRTDPAAVGLLRNDGLLMMGLSAPLLPVDLLAGEALPNEDAAAPARSNLLFGARVITQTALAGDLVQTASGRMLADVAFGAFPSDRISATGTAAVAGTLDVTLTHLANAVPYTLIAATGGGVNNGMAVTDTLAMDYSVAGGPAGITLSFVPRFDLPTLWPNGQALGRHMNSALLVGDSAGIGRLMALLGNLRPGEESRFRDLMLQLTPEAWLTPLKLHYQSADNFRRQLMGRNAVDTEAGTLWANGEFDSFSQYSRADQFAANAEQFVLSGGGTARLGEQWQVTAGAAYRRINRLAVREGALADGNGDAVQVGAVLGWSPDEAFRLSVGVAGGWQWLRARRNTAIFEPISAYVEPQARFVQVAASASYDWRWKNGYLRPSFDVAGTALRQDGYSEQGLGGIGSAALRSTQWLWSLNPMLAGGVTLAEGQGTKVELALRGGGVFQLEDTITMPFRLIGANPAADPAQLALGLNRAAAIVGGDLVINWKERLTLSGGFQSVRGNRDNITSARLQMRLAF